MLHENKVKHLSFYSLYSMYNFFYVYDSLIYLFTNSNLCPFTMTCCFFNIKISISANRNYFIYLFFFSKYYVLSAFSLLVTPKDIFCNITCFLRRIRCRMLRLYNSIMYIFMLSSSKTCNRISDGVFATRLIPDRGSE